MPTIVWKTRARPLAGLLLLPALALAAALEPAAGLDAYASVAGAEATAGAITLEEADRRLDVADRMLQGGIYDNALAFADSVLDAPEAPGGGDAGSGRDWLARRERARFIRERGRFGLAKTRDELEDVAEAFVQLSNNRYRLDDPAYAVQSAYWAGRVFEDMGEYREAVEQFSRVGGVALPRGMEGEAALRMSRNLRMMAGDIPYPGGVQDRRRRDRLLNQAIAELDRARLAFPVGDRRREIELDLIALRMARREEQFIREAASEAEAFIAGDPTRGELRARAVLYRGRAAAMLGDPAAAADWYRRVIDEEAPSEDILRGARLGLALSLEEMSGSAEAAERDGMRRQAVEALDLATRGTVSPGPWDGARVIRARMQLELNLPSAALETLSPILDGGRVNPVAWHLAGTAELRRGRLDDAFAFLYPPTRPSNARNDIRHAAARDASRVASVLRDYGMALALNHQASRLLRRDRLYSTLLVSEFHAMEILLRMGRVDTPVSLASDADFLSLDSDPTPIPLAVRKRDAAVRMGTALGRVLLGGGNPDDGYDLALAAEAAAGWTGDPSERLELAVAMISHLRKRQPAGVTDGTLLSRLGEARQTLALVRAERILSASEPDEDAVNRTLGDFAAAAASFQEAVAGGASRRDSLDLAMVNMESGAFLMRLAEMWERGRWAPRAQIWRNEARQRIEASIRPFNQAIATAGPASVSSRRAKWSRGRALELLGEWRAAAADYLSLMNDSELPRLLRANAARHWAVCMGELGEHRAALTRLAVFAAVDAEAALVAGRLAEDAGYFREAYRHYLFAADLESPALPPATPGRAQEAAYRAARLALKDPGEADPLLPPEEVVAAARRLLETGVRADLLGRRVVPMLTLLGESLMEDPGGWDAAYRLAAGVLETRDVPVAVRRAMHILAARALALGGNHSRALEELDFARELLDDSPASRADAASTILETARIFRDQGRSADALRAYADVFAVYPEQGEFESAARVESAVMLLSNPDADERDREQARNILNHLSDRMLADRIMREHGIM